MEANLHHVKEADDTTSTDFLFNTLQTRPTTQEFFKSAWLLATCPCSVLVPVHNLPETLAVVDNVVVSKNHKHRRE